MERDARKESSAPVVEASISYALDTGEKPVNETLELGAEKGPLKGKAKVLAQKDQRVTIKLSAPVAAPPKGPRMCEVEMDGLKILRPCP